MIFPVIFEQVWLFDRSSLNFFLFKPQQSYFQNLLLDLSTVASQQQQLQQCLEKLKSAQLHQQ